MLFWLPGLVSFGISLLYQLRIFDTRVVFIFDSGHYLLTSSQVLSVLKCVISGCFGHATELIHQPDFVASIMIDGPILPLTGALVFLLSGQPAVATSWPAMVTALALLNAASTSVIACITKKVTDSAAIGLCAALLFAVYPSTIITSGRFLTEPVATFLLVSLALYCSKIASEKVERASVLSSFVAGLLGALGFLLKPALLPAWLGLVLLAVAMRFRAKYSVLKSIAALLVGFTSISLSWLSLTYIATGQYRLMPNRMLVENLMVGHSLQTDGRGAKGDSPKSITDGETENANYIFKTAWRQHPRQMGSLYLRKATRALGYVWNDFKQVVFGLDIDSQNFIHGIVLTMATAGLFLGFLELAQTWHTTASDRTFYLLSIIFMIVTHILLYLPFEANTRYGATALPFLIVAAGLAVSVFLRAGIKKNICAIALVLLLVVSVKWSPNVFPFLSCDLGTAVVVLAVVRIVAILVCFFFLSRLVGTLGLTAMLSNRRKRLLMSASCCLALIFVLLPIATTTLFVADQRDSAIDLPGGGALTRHFTIPSINQTSQSRYLMYLDCDKRCSDARFFVNGVPVSGSIVSANKIDSTCYSLFNIMRMYACVYDLPVEEMRQWRVLELPPSLIKFGTVNQLKMEAGSEGITVFADRFCQGESQIRLPKRTLFSPSKLCNEGKELDGRVLELTGTNILPASTYTCKPKSVSRQLSQRQPRLYIMQLSQPSSVQPHHSSSLSAPTRRFNFEASMFDPVLLAPGTESVLNVTRYTMQLARKNSATCALPVQFKNVQAVQVNLIGKVRATGRAKKLGIFITVNGSESNSQFLILPAVPPYIACSNEWTDFSITDRIFLTMYTKENCLLNVSMFPGRWEQFSQYGIDRSVGSFHVKDLRLTVRALDDIDLADGATTIF